MNRLHESFEEKKIILLRVKLWCLYKIQDVVQEKKIYWKNDFDSYTLHVIRIKHIIKFKSIFDNWIWNIAFDSFLNCFRKSVCDIKMRWNHVSYWDTISANRISSVTVSFFYTEDSNKIFMYIKFYEDLSSEFCLNSHDLCVCNLLHELCVRRQLLIFFFYLFSQNRLWRMSMKLYGRIAGQTLVSMRISRSKYSIVRLFLNCLTIYLFLFFWLSSVFWSQTPRCRCDILG